MRKYSIVLLLVLLSLVVLLLAACGGGQAASSGPTEVHVRMTDFEFEMDKTSIPAGPVKFIFQNDGKETHEAVLELDGANDEPFEVDGKESEVEDVAVGATATLEWTIDEPGKYQLGCHITDDNEDHYELGMHETFTVTAN